MKMTADICDRFLTLTFDPCPPLLCCVDYATGFGGRYGVQADRVDQSAVGFDYQGKTEKHESQKGLFRSPDMQKSH